MQDDPKRGIGPRQFPDLLFICLFVALPEVELQDGEQRTMRSLKIEHLVAQLERERSLVAEKALKFRLPLRMLFLLAGLAKRQKLVHDANRRRWASWAI